LNKLRSWTLGLVILVLALVGCSPPPPLPTVAVLPSSTITLTPSKTLTPTFTPTFTPSLTPSLTPTSTASSTLTLTPSLTFTPTDTETPIPTETPVPTDTPLPTETFTPTFTRTPLPTKTPLPTLTPTVAPLIRTFTVDPTTAIAGSTILVRWDVDADHVEIDLLNQGNGLIEGGPVSTQGNRTFLPQAGNGTVQIVRLTATKGGNTVVSTVSVSVQCPSPWFFSPPPPGGGCPSQQQLGAFTYQQFQIGQAFFIPNTNMIYFLANGGIAASYSNTWNVSIPVPTSIPPAGLFDPTGPIGYVWHVTTWPDGRAFVNVIGWATAAFVNYNGTLQVGPGGEIYLRSPTGALYQIKMNGNQGTWTQLVQ
jgi:hypothetical protein